MRGQRLPADLDAFDKTIARLARLDASHHGGDRRCPRPLAHRFVDRIMRHQLHPPVSQAGEDQHMRFGIRQMQPRGGEMMPHANPVSTAFAIQALEVWRTSTPILPPI